MTRSSWIVLGIVIMTPVVSFALGVAFGAWLS